MTTSPVKRIRKTESPTELPRSVVLLTIGSRGDVAPLITLAAEMKRRDPTMRPCVVTHPEHADLVTRQNVEFRSLGGSSNALLDLVTRHRVIGPSLLREANELFMPMLDEMTEAGWRACHDAQLILTSPFSFLGPHIAEARKIPLVYVSMIPWTSTNEFPHPFTQRSLDHTAGPLLSSISYRVLDSAIWLLVKGVINTWRTTRLLLPESAAPDLTKHPCIYMNSTVFIPRPSDYPEDHIMCGNIVHLTEDESRIPSHVVKFVKEAKSPIVYIGFGSVVSSSLQETMDAVLDELTKTNLTTLVALGQSDVDVKPAPRRMVVKEINHGWLFPKVAVTVHHAGAGTLMASVICGRPSLCMPFFGDQIFNTKRGVELGIAIAMEIPDAELIVAAVKNKELSERTCAVGLQIRKERGISNLLKELPALVHKQM
jgi:sterol 3beta-glucosyltransferase